MANWTKLKKAIADVIKTNGNQEITGAIMQQTLMSIVDNVGGNAQFAGVAVPSTVPADTDGSVFYLASTQGSYPNFSNIKVNASEMAIFTKNTAGTWVKTSLPIQHPTIKKPLLIGGNVAAVTKGTGVVLSVPTLNADGTETASELSIEAATPSNNGAMTKDQVNTLKEVDDFYTRMTDFVIGDNDDRALINIESTRDNIKLKYKTLDTVNGDKVERTKTIPVVDPAGGGAGAAGIDLIHDIPYFFDFYRPGFTSLPYGSDITKILIPKFRASYDEFDDLYTDVPAIQNKVFVNPKAGDRILIGSLFGVIVDTKPLWATVTSAQFISNVYSVTVDYDGDTYIFAFVVSNDTATLKVPWSKVSPKRNMYTNDLKQLDPEWDEARIKDYLTPQAYRAYRIVYPVKPQTGDLVEEYHNDKLRYVAIKVVRNKENPGEYTDILIPESGTANAYTRIVLKNDFTAVKSRNPYYTLKTCGKRAYNGNLLLALDTVKAETIKNSISDAYSFTIEGRNTQLAAELPDVGDIISIDYSNVPVCEVLIRAAVQHTRWFYNGKLYEVLVNTALTRVPEDPKVIYDTNSGTLRDLYISAGAKYNEATGYYELNGLTDITEEEMRVIYDRTWGWWLHLPSLNGFGSALPRTNIPCPDYKIIAYAPNISIHSIFSVSGNDDNLEVVNLRALYTPSTFDEIKVVELNWAFQSDKKLREVQGIINVVKAKSDLSIGGNIETINIKGLKNNIKFYDSNRLSKESVLYMINNSAATSAITIGLNKAVYDAMKNDIDIIEALADKHIVLSQNT